MKMYMIYHTDVESNILPHLYACTQHKEYMKQFMKQRNNKYFVVREHSMAKEEGTLFLSQHSSCMLRVGRFVTHAVDDNGIVDAVVFEMICTGSEEMFAVANCRDNTLYHLYEKYKEVMKIADLLGKDMQQEFAKMLQYYKIPVHMDPTPTLDDIALSNDPASRTPAYLYTLEMDELAMFVHLFDRTIDL